MKKVIAMVFVALMTVVNAEAQKIQVVDSLGNAIPLVSVLTEDGVIIGNTDFDGTLADVKGAKKVALTHVAYKPQLVEIATLTNSRITMKSIDYGLDEVVVKPKPYLYKEYYYRAFYYIGDSLRAYGAGIVPVAYDIKNNYKTKIRSVWSTGVFANKAATWHGAGMKYRVEASLKNYNVEPFEKWSIKEKAQEEYHTKMVSDGPNRWRVELPTKEVVGQVVHSDGLNRTSLDGARMQLYADEVHGRKKMLKARQERNYQYQYVSIYSMDDDETTDDIIRHVMTMDRWEYDSGKGRMIEIYYFYTVDYSYMEKDEFKARSKELNKGRVGDMSLAELLQYERTHNIPALAPGQLQAIKALKKGKKE